MLTNFTAEGVMDYVAVNHRTGKQLSKSSYCSRLLTIERFVKGQEGVCWDDAFELKIE